MKLTPETVAPLVTVTFEVAAPAPTVPICCKTSVSLGPRPSAPGTGNEIVAAPTGMEEKL